MSKKPRFLRWDWIAVFSGVLLMISGAINVSAGGEVGLSIAAGFLILCLGATLLIADY